MLWPEIYKGVNTLKNTGGYLRLIVRAMSTADMCPEYGLKKYAFATGNGEHYWASEADEVHQRRRKNFQGVTYGRQKDLPSLPVPDLQNTIDRYLLSVQPYCRTSQQFESQKAKCAEFLKQEGPILQSRLLDLAKNTSNWMSKLWDEQAYLNQDVPLTPYVSYFYVHKKTAADYDPLVKSAAIITTVVKFIEALKDESLPPEIIKGTPFCMNSFQMMFNNSRIPGLPSDNKDTNVFYSIYEHGYVVVSYKGHFFKLFTHDKEMKPLSLGGIWKQLYKIVHIEAPKIESGPDGQNKGIGILTTLPRSQWREYYEELQKDATTRESLSTIHKSSFILCLDMDSYPITIEEKSRYAWHGNGYNRYFDKPLQFFVAGNGTSSFIAEHSKMDGTPTLFLNHYLCKQLSGALISDFKEQILLDLNNDDSQPQHMPFLITPKIQTGIAEASSKFANERNSHQLKVFHYNKYGKSFIKHHGFSPDAFIQQVIQLATFKYFGKQLPTYEAGSTRKYFKGRTEAGRSVSNDSALFVRLWEAVDTPTSTKIDALKKAARSHSQYMKMAADGQAIDRHFFGLKNMLTTDELSGNKVPELFQDPLFKYSSTWLISTSQLSSEYFEGYGWSEVHDNGVGLAYMLNNSWMHINIVTKPSTSGISVEKMHYYLCQAADEIGDALEQTNAKL